MSEESRKQEYTLLNTKMLWGMFTAMLAAIIIQKFI